MVLTQEDVRALMSRATVGIAGLGGLGSNLAAALARMSVGRMILVDFDTVERKNLDRQYYFPPQVGMLKTEALRENISLIDPDVCVEVHCLRLTAGDVARAFGDADIVAECLDGPEDKAMLARVFLDELAPRGKKLVAVSGIAGDGPANDIVTKRVHDDFVLVGDGRTDIEDDPLLLASRVGIAALHQANQIVRWVVGRT